MANRAFTGPSVCCPINLIKRKQWDYIIITQFVNVFATKLNDEDYSKNPCPWEIHEISNEAGGGLVGAAASAAYGHGFFYPMT